MAAAEAGGTSGIRGILLAAGRSSRFGSNKLLHPLPDGTALAVASALHLAEALPNPLAVLRPGVPELEAALRAAGCEIVICERAHEGMGLSLACAVGASGTPGGWLVALADMPFIQPATLRRIAQAVADGAPVAAPLYQGQRGHPVCFTGALRDELLILQGDEGARQVFKQHAAKGRMIEVADAGVLRDIDRPEDLST